MCCAGDGCMLNAGDGCEAPLKELIETSNFAKKWTETKIRKVGTMPDGYVTGASLKRRQAAN
jgi:hypothetical protein